MSTNDQQPPLLIANGVTAPEFAVLCAVHFGMNAEPADLPRHAFAEGNSLGGTITEEDCHSGLASCLVKGWLQIIDENSLAQITSDLRARGVLGPIYHLPSPGQVDFTPAGVSLWNQLCPDDGDRSFAYTDVVHSQISHYFQTEHSASGSNRGNLSRIGPWCIQWWRRYSSGFCRHVEEIGRWQGGNPRGSNWFAPRSQDCLHEPNRLRVILDTHNVTIAEWLVMAWIDSHWRKRPLRLLPQWMSQKSQEFCGFSLTGDECRVGLDACLAHGSVRIVDKAVQEEIAGLLRSSGTISPWAEVIGNIGELDFTPNGAVLYQMISVEYRGSDWDAEICLSTENYRKEHRYCRTREAIQTVLDSYETSGEKLTSKTTTTIGPWCVYWWKEFSDGYLLETEIGSLQRQNE